MSTGTSYAFWSKGTTGLWRVPPRPDGKSDLSAVQKWTGTEWIADPDDRLVGLMLDGDMGLDELTEAEVAQRFPAAIVAA